MQRIICPFEVKSDNSNDGTITGYGSTFGNIDSYGDTVARGAFAKSLAAINSGDAPWPPMLSQHSADVPIGIWTEISEDERGLKLTGKLAIKNTRGSEAYALLKMKPRPALNGLSIGFQAKNYTLHKTGDVRRTLTEIALKEVSLVTFPADQYARVIGVKSHAEPEPVVDEAASFKAWVRSDIERLQQMHKAAHDGRPKYG